MPPATRDAPHGGPGSAPQFRGPGRERLRPLAALRPRRRCRAARRLPALGHRTGCSGRISDCPTHPVRAEPRRGRIAGRRRHRVRLRGSQRRHPGRHAHQRPRHRESWLDVRPGSRRRRGIHHSFRGGESTRRDGHRVHERYRRAPGRIPFSPSNPDATSHRIGEHHRAAADRSPSAEPLGQPRWQHRARLRGPIALELGRAAGTDRPAESRITPAPTPRSASTASSSTTSTRTPQFSRQHIYKKSRPWRERSGPTAFACICQ